MFPACVGMNRKNAELLGKVKGVPRVCGDEPIVFWF